MKNTPKTYGFTLIEMIVSLGVFAVVVTITTGALLMLIAGNQRFQNEQNIMTNLSFAVDSMTREIRTGTAYYCDGGNATVDLFKFQESIGTNNHGYVAGIHQKDCVDGANGSVKHGLSFREGGQSVTRGNGVRVAYYYDGDDKTIYRRVGNDEPQSIIASNVLIEEANFVVSGSRRLFNAPLGNAEQPSVTVFLRARAESDTSVPPKEYYVQTTVTQRTLDL